MRCSTRCCFFFSLHNFSSPLLLSQLFKTVAIIKFKIRKEKKNKKKQSHFLVSTFDILYVCSHWFANYWILLIPQCVSVWAALYSLYRIPHLLEILSLVTSVVYSWMSTGLKKSSTLLFYLFNVAMTSIMFIHQISFVCFLYTVLQDACCMSRNITSLDLLQEAYINLCIQKLWLFVVACEGVVLGRDVPFLHSSIRNSQKRKHRHTQQTW